MPYRPGYDLNIERSIGVLLLIVVFNAPLPVQAQGATTQPNVIRRSNGTYAVTAPQRARPPAGNGHEGAYGFTLRLQKELGITRQR